MSRKVSGEWAQRGTTVIRQISKVAITVLLCMAVSTPALTQTNDDVAAGDRAAKEELYKRFEAERRRQQQVNLEKDRVQREKLQLENERLRRENERREEEKLRLEIELLRQENANRRLEQLRLENEAMARQRSQAAAVASNQSQSPDVYEQLRAIGQLKADGILTDEEFQRLKRKILE